MDQPQPDFALELVEEAGMPEELDRAIRRLLCECFPDHVAIYSATRSWYSSVPTWSVVHCRGRDVVGHVSIFVRTVACGKTPVPVAGVGNLGVARPLRGSGLSGQLLDRALDEAVGRGIDFGLLFCLPALEKFYRAWSWVKTDAPMHMLDPAGTTVPIPAANLGMVRQLAGRPLPPGPIHLNGSDW